METITREQFFNKAFMAQFRIGDVILVERPDPEPNQVYRRVDKRKWKNHKSWKPIE